MASDQDVDLDSIIDRLLEVRGSRPGKQVQLLEQEIRYLCTKAREIFISQPILLELEAPIKVRPSCHFRTSCTTHHIPERVKQLAQHVAGSWAATTHHESESPP